MQKNPKKLACTNNLERYVEHDKKALSHCGPDYSLSSENALPGGLFVLGCISSQSFVRHTIL